MDEIIISALAQRIKAEEMALEQAPLPYREQLETLINQ